MVTVGLKGSLRPTAPSRAQALPWDGENCSSVRNIHTEHTNTDCGKGTELQRALNIKIPPLFHSAPAKTPQTWLAQGARAGLVGVEVLEQLSWSSCNISSSSQSPQPCLEPAPSCPRAPWGHRQCMAPNAGGTSPAWWLLVEELLRNQLREVTRGRCSPTLALQSRE